MELTLERKGQEAGGLVGGGMAITPAIDEDYWTYRVRLNETGQAVVGFPKFGTLGIGFAQEEDWNTNLPYSVDTEQLFNHIAKNKGDEAIDDDDVRKAIRLVQDAAEAGKGTEWKAGF